MRVKGPPQEHNTMDPAKALTWTLKFLMPVLALKTSGIM
jgi:hypothetical protein